MLFETLNWMDVEAYLQRDDRLIFTVGSCEQHGYLSLLTDSLIPMALAQEVARTTGVLVAPPLHYGITPAFTRFPGSISLRPETYAAVIRDLLTGFLAQGFRRILVNNGHGGNIGVLTPVLVELGTQHPEARFELYSWWLDAGVAEVARSAGLETAHANWMEAFSFTRVCPLPAGSKPAVSFISRVAPPDAVRQAIGDGSFGGAYSAPDDVMAQLFQAAVAGLEQTLLALG